LNPRIAIVADWLSAYAGSERVLEQMIGCYPEADIHAVVDFLPDADRAFLGGKQPTTTFIQRLPFARRHFRFYLPLMPLAIEQLDLSGYDLILSSSHAVAKGVIVGPDQLHLSYVHSPMRYAWDLQHQYLAETGLDHRWLGWVARVFLHRLRLWDVRTPFGVDAFMANSGFIRRRIHRVYGRDATVIYPPVDTESFSCRTAKEDFYLTASRMVPYKRMDLIVAAFTATPHRRLVVIGDGPEAPRIRRQAGPNIEFLGHLPGEVLRDYMQRARAFVFAAEEDFGIVAVEAQACGTPVIAYGKGGSLETVRGWGDTANPTGVFFEQQTVESLNRAVDTFEAKLAEFDPVAIRRHAETFSTARFRREFKSFVDRAVQTWQAENRQPMHHIDATP
jgi:glycosyltransferase involved in cell wall biosynthesis